MVIDFDELPDHARLWVYQASRKFSAAEENVVRGEAHAFCAQWTAHGQPLKTAYKVEHNQFLILAVDEDFNDASGCSIDGSVHMLKSQQDVTGIDFFDRSKVAFLINHEVKLVPLAELRDAFVAGTLGPATLTFNVHASSKGAWEKSWILPADKTWLTRYLPKTSVA